MQFEISRKRLIFKKRQTGFKFLFLKIQRFLYYILKHRPTINLANNNRETVKIYKKYGLSALYTYNRMCSITKIYKLEKKRLNRLQIFGILPKEYHYLFKYTKYLEMFKSNDTPISFFCGLLKSKIYKIFYIGNILAKIRKQKKLDVFFRQNKFINYFDYFIVGFLFCFGQTPKLFQQSLCRLLSKTVKILIILQKNNIINFLYNCLDKIADRLFKQIESSWNIQFIYCFNQKNYTTNKKIFIFQLPTNSVIPYLYLKQQQTEFNENTNTKSIIKKNQLVSLVVTRLLYHINTIPFYNSFFTEQFILQKTVHNLNRTSLQNIPRYSLVLPTKTLIDLQTTNEWNQIWQALFSMTKQYRNIQQQISKRFKEVFKKLKKIRQQKHFLMKSQYKQINLVKKNIKNSLISRVLNQTILLKTHIKYHQVFPLGLQKKLFWIKAKSICMETSRTRNIYSVLGLHRMRIKHLVEKGLIVGLRKASW